MLSILQEINIAVVKDLLRVLDLNATELHALVPRLIMPGLRDGSARISEQESRVLFCSVLDKTYGYFYSIETPTKEKYQFSGKNPLSARSDLSIWRFDGNFNKIANVELKAHNPAQDSINKDIEKLVREKVIGNWFHTLKNIDNKTIPALFDKFKSSFSGFKSEDVACPIVFSFCVLDLKLAIMKVFDPAGVQLDLYVDEFFKLNYIVRQGKVLIEAGNENGWLVIQ